MSCKALCSRQSTGTMIPQGSQAVLRNNIYHHEKRHWSISTIVKILGNDKVRSSILQRMHGSHVHQEEFNALTQTPTVPTSFRVDSRCDFLSSFVLSQMIQG